MSQGRVREHDGAGEYRQQAGAEQRPRRAEIRMHPLRQHAQAEKHEPGGAQGVGQHERRVAWRRVIGRGHAGGSPGTEVKRHPRPAQFITPATGPRGDDAPERRSQ